MVENGQKCTTQYTEARADCLRPLTAIASARPSSSLFRTSDSGLARTTAYSCCAL